MRTVCYFHAHCRDGITAALAVRHKFPDAELIAMDHDSPEPELEEGCNVYVVDYCFPLEESERLILKSNEFWLFDHHEGSLPIIGALLQRRLAGAYPDKHFHVHYEPRESGAAITWQHFYGKQMDDPPNLNQNSIQGAPGKEYRHGFKIPEIVWYVSDRDLWNFHLPRSREINRALDCVPLTLEAMAPYLDDPNQEDLLDNLAAVGEMLMLYNERAVQIDSVIRTTMRMVTIAEHQVPLLNCPSYLVSDGLDSLCDKHPFVVSYFDTPRNRKYSIRSKKGGINVIPIAKLFGGGGHENAAGWYTKHSDPFPE